MPVVCGRQEFQTLASKMVLGALAGAFVFYAQAVHTARAAPLTFSTTTVALTSSAIDLTIASGSTADSFTVNATSVVVSLSATGGSSFTLTSPQADLLVTASAGGGKTPLTTCSGTPGMGAVAEAILTQQSGSAAYTITPGGRGCVSINNTGGITIYPIEIDVPSYASTTVGNTLEIPVSVTDPNGYPVSLSATLPPDASFSTSTDELTWRPKATGKASATILALDKVMQTTSTIGLEAFTPTASLTRSVSGIGAPSSRADFSVSSTPSIIALKAEIAILRREVQNLLAELKGQGAAISHSLSYAFNRDLTVGSRGQDVHTLQVFLVQQNTGPAARALERNGTTEYFGPLTRAALAEYQAKVGIEPAVGYLGPITRTYLRSH